MKNQKEKLKEEEEKRDLFCIINDLFRFFARHSSIVLGSAWAFTLAIVIILILGPDRSNFSFF